MKLHVNITAPEDTARLARALAGTWREERRETGGLPRILLLQGELGAGKTTLVRFLVESLPGGETAEVSSPSFTLCNSYACEPPVLHFDLYRLAPGQMDGDLDEALELAEDGDLLLIIEWPERISGSSQPAGGLHCRLLAAENGGRRAVLGLPDAAGQTLLSDLAGRLRRAGLEVSTSGRGSPPEPD